MLEFAISFWLRWRSFLIVCGNRGGNAYHERNAITVYPSVSVSITTRMLLHGIETLVGRNQLGQNQEHLLKPNQAKKKTLPYLLKGFRTGTDLAFPFTGLISGACQRVAILKPMLTWC